VRYTRVDKVTAPTVMGRGVDEGMTAEGEGDGEGVTARVGLAEGVGVAKPAT